MTDVRFSIGVHTEVRFLGQIAEDNTILVVCNCIAVALQDVTIEIAVWYDDEAKWFRLLRGHPMEDKDQVAFRLGPMPETRGMGGAWNWD